MSGGASTVKGSKSKDSTTTSAAPSSGAAAAAAAAAPRPASVFASAAGGAGGDAWDLKSSASSVPADLASEMHVCGKASGRQSHPEPMLNFVTVEEEDSGVIVIRMPSDRPPTQLNTQGRHVSAYVLMLEAVLTRIQGKTFDDGVDAIDVMLGEYISGADLLADYRKTVEAAKKSVKKDMFDREERVKIEMALRAALRFFRSSEVQDTVGALDDSVLKNRLVKDTYGKDRAAVLAVADIDPGHVRDLLKRGGEFLPASIVIKVAIANAVKLLNKMDEVAFDPKKTKPEKGEGTLISNAMGGLQKVLSLSDGQVYESKYVKDIGQWIADLFDYPKAEFEDVLVGDKEGSARMCRNVIRRHIKLIYDAFPNLRPVFYRKDELKKMLRPLLEKVIEDFKWVDVGDSKRSFVNIDSLWSIVRSLLIIDDKGCSLDDAAKFSAAKPGYPRVATESAAREGAALTALAVHRASPPGGAAAAGGAGVSAPGAKK